MLDETLLLICGKSLSQDIFPSQLKISQITPVFKKGDENEISNYRLFSVLSCISKNIEKTVVNKICKYFLDNNKLALQQFGYRLGVFTETATHSLLRDIYIWLFKGLIFVFLFFSTWKKNFWYG